MRLKPAVKRSRGPGGNAIFTVNAHRYYWNGPGSRLKLMLGDQLVTIDAPEASGHYETSHEAEAALRRFVGLPPKRAKRRRS